MGCYGDISDRTQSMLYHFLIFHGDIMWWDVWYMGYMGYIKAARWHGGWSKNVGFSSKLCPLNEWVTGCHAILGTINFILWIQHDRWWWYWMTVLSNGALQMAHPSCMYTSRILTVIYKTGGYHGLPHVGLAYDIVSSPSRLFHVQMALR